jgi:hypothetical protein
VIQKSGNRFSEKIMCSTKMLARRHRGDPKAHRRAGKSQEAPREGDAFIGGTGTGKTFRGLAAAFVVARAND